MPKIGLREIKAAYALALKVAQGTISEAEAGNTLVTELDMNFSSAMGYLRKRRQLLNGEVYTRTMNATATRFFLENIYQDEGVEGLRSALSSVRKHTQYYTRTGKSALPSITALIDEFAVHLHSSALMSVERVEEEWQNQLSASRKLSSRERRSKLPAAGHRPARVTVSTTVFARSPHVVVEVLEHAAGICDGCMKPAPFIKRRDGTPYLEVHHRVTLAQGGEDTVENAVALCPNCHRERHFGSPLTSVEPSGD